ncbi:LTA synthase family protein [Bacillus bombysepticus]|uniref:LTA synthase family protein n=1 Tax=Bacillus bombysepticus TaxID=658666 RepID=UPI00301AC5CD
MIALLLLVWLFLSLRMFGLEEAKDYMNQKLSLSISYILLWAGTIYLMLYFKRMGKKLKLKARVYIFAVFYILANTMSMLLIYMQNDLNTIQTADWLYEQVAPFMFSFVFIYSLYLITFALSGSLFFTSVFTSTLLLVFSITNYLKILFRGDPFYPSDFTQIAHLKSVLPMVMDSISAKSIWLSILGIVCSIFLILYLRKYITPVKIHPAIRVIIGISSVWIIYMYANYSNNFVGEWFEKRDVNFILWNQKENYTHNGTVLGFISNLDTTVAKEPKGYTKDNVIKIAHKIKNNYKSLVTSDKKANKPNVIFMMSEAFWDPTKLTKLNFNEDPLPNLHQYIMEYPAGQTISPTFGGGTANTEFEALTSYSMSFLNPGSIPYQQAIPKKKQIPSIVSELKENGYHTTAIHSFERNFFKRDYVYSILGFDEFIASDTMKHTVQDGNGYISDISISKEIMDELKSSKKPTFIHTVTMQNHFPFTPGRYEETRTKIEGLNEESTGQLEEYTEGLRRSDEALHYLIEEINTLDEPTLLVFFGDHLPALGLNNSIFKEAGYIISGKTVKERLAMSETPLLIYANFPLPNDDLGMKSPIYFSNMVFDYIGIKKSPFYRFLSELQEEIPVLKDDLKVDRDGNEIDLNKDQREMLKQYQLVQYDLLVGKQYSKDILFH